jgi:hypothetical protein
MTNETKSVYPFSSCFKSTDGWRTINKLSAGIQIRIKLIPNFFEKNIEKEYSGTHKRRWEINTENDLTNTDFGNGDRMWLLIN